MVATAVLHLYQQTNNQAHLASIKFINERIQCNRDVNTISSLTSCSKQTANKPTTPELRRQLNKSI